MKGESPLIQCQGLADEKRLTTLATFGAIPQALGGDPVDAVTVRADDM
jgi:hypothetical protein